MSTGVQEAILSGPDLDAAFAATVADLGPLDTASGVIDSANVGPHPAASPDSVVIVGGGGANARHFQGATENLARIHPVHIFEVGTPPADLPENVTVHMVDTPAGEQSAHDLLKGGVHAVYASLIPSLHLNAVNKYLGYAAQGKVDAVVLPKPIVENIAELREVDALLAEAQRARAALDPNYDPKRNPLLYVHEHYIGKGAWTTLQEQLGTITQILGRPRSVRIDIAEARTVEQEGRQAAFGGGALQDLGPHVLSLALGIQDGINNSGRFSIPDGLDSTVRRLRYQDSALEADVDTGFAVTGTSTIRDRQTGAEHELPYEWYAGKGMEDRKGVRLEFEDPTTGTVSFIVVDLLGNTLDLPEPVRYLFPEVKFADNGYGFVVERGLNGGDPNRSFQSYDQARMVTKLQALLARLGGTALLAHQQGDSLSQVQDRLQLEDEVQRQMRFTAAIRDGKFDLTQTLIDEARQAGRHSEARAYSDERDRAWLRKDADTTPVAA